MTSKVSTKSSHDEIVISFFAIIQMMVKYPASERIINWHLRLFDKEVADMSPDCPRYAAANRMSEELAMCGRRRRSRRSMYNMSSIDEIYNNYWGGKSPNSLRAAWSLFETGRYRTEGRQV